MEPDVVFDDLAGMAGIERDERQMAAKWTEFTARQWFEAKLQANLLDLLERIRFGCYRAPPDASIAAGAAEPATRLRKSPMPAILAVVGGGIRRMSVRVLATMSCNRWLRLLQGSQPADLRILARGRFRSARRPRPRVREAP
jgi:hypothetical protein